jgi:hypothetical protein
MLGPFTSSVGGVLPVPFARRIQIFSDGDIARLSARMEFWQAWSTTLFETVVADLRFQDIKACLPSRCLQRHIAFRPPLRLLVLLTSEDYASPTARYATRQISCETILAPETLSSSAIPCDACLGISERKIGG